MILENTKWILRGFNPKAFIGTWYKSLRATQKRVFGKFENRLHTFGKVRTVQGIQITLKDF